jgi:hypothetical protein
MKPDVHFVRVNETCFQNGVRIGAMGGIIGGLMAFFDGFSHPVSSNPMRILGRAGAKFIIPGMFAGAVFGSTTCLLDSKRGKDKQLTNSLIGGCIAGCALGTKTLNPGTCLAMGLGFGVIAVVVRGGFVGIVKVDEKQLEELNKSLNMKRIVHLAPQASARQ